MKRLILTIGILFLFSVFTQAQDGDEGKKNEKKEQITIKIKDGANPIIYIDGKEYDKEIIQLIDKDKIKSIKVIKGDSAWSVFKSPNVILISTEEGNKKDVFSVKLDHDYDYIYTYDINVDSIREVHMPRVIINGDLVDPDSLKKIDPENIVKISVLKDKKIMTEYNTKKGVIIVTTKEKGKKPVKKVIKIDDID